MDGEKPSSYIIILKDTKISNHCSVDVRISAQTIMLGAVEMGLGGCMFDAVKHD